MQYYFDLSFKFLETHCDRSVGLSGTIVFSNKTDHHDIAKILLKVALNTITPYP